MTSLLNKIFGDPNEKILKEIRVVVEQINKFEDNLKSLTDEELRAQTSRFKGIISDGLDLSRYSVDENIRTEVARRLNHILPEAFAVMREASRRVLGLRHYDVQLIGGIVLHRGQIAEMKTGEGKTLVATLPLYLNALAGLGVHLVTVNDYLSRVGAGWMAPVYEFLGMTSAVIMHDQALIFDPEYSDDKQFDDRLKHFRPVARKEAYACDILYGTNNEFGFDYLRDNMAPNLETMVQRGLVYSIVDEIDSILIDEARTPLIISAAAEESTDKYYQFAELVSRLVENEDYNIDEKMRAATLTESGISKMEKWLGVENIYTSRGIKEVHHIEQALKALALFKLDRDYVVKDGEVVIVDEFTGRMMFGRRYSDGLHQAIEAKEKVKIQRESQTMATITFQNYFRMYHKLSGMTGTAVTEAEEFAKIYSLDVVIIPTNKPNIRIDNGDLIYKTEMGKFKAVIEDVKKRSQAGQPCLVGTISIEKNEMLISLMEREGLRPEVLNAKNHEREARIIADAGKSGAITIATNMAGRGVDIVLGGQEPAKGGSEYTAWKIEHEKVVTAGGLHVVGTERHESRRIDNQLRGRAGRQGDPGSSQFFISMDDDLMRIFGGDRMKKVMTALRVPEDMPIENKMISRSIESAQVKVEGNNFDIRKHLVEYDDVINKHREAIYRRRREVLDLFNNGDKENNDGALSSIALEMVENEIEQVVIFHTAAEQVRDWNLDEIYQVVSTIFPVEKSEKDVLEKFRENDHKLDKASARTAIIEHLTGLAKEIYSKIDSHFKESGMNWQEVEKAVLVRSIDTMWVEHLEAVASVRQGIGLRGYGQRDPLVEYKREAYLLYNELNSLIQKEMAYSIFKIGLMHSNVSAQSLMGNDLSSQSVKYSAPAKELTSNTSSFMHDESRANETKDLVKPKTVDSDGNKVGRNDPCPCGSGLKYKKCHGK